MHRKVVAVALLALACSGLAAWHFARAPAADDAIVLYGNVDLRQVALAFNGSERITGLHVQEGERVTAGQVLGTLDTRATDLQLAQADARIAVRTHALNALRQGSRPQEVARARAAVREAQADARLAAQQLDRLLAVRKDTGGRAVSQQDVDAARTRQRMTEARLESANQALALTIAGPRQEDIAQAQAQLQVARAERALLAHHLEESRLIAPIDAVVRSRLLEPGDMASPQRPAFLLAITDPKWVRAYVAQTDLGRIRPGMAASIVTDGQPDALAGRIGYISSVAEFTPKTVQTEDLRTSLVYEVRVLVNDPADRLRLGMPATVRIALAPAAHAAAGPAP